MSHQQTYRFRVFGLSLLACCAVLSADDDQFLADRQPPYGGPGFTADTGGERSIEFPANGITLLSQIPVTQFGPRITSANDCWGYVSPSGREYAIIGLSGGTGFVEVTTPGSPQITAVLSGPTSIWRDIKVHKQYAYAVSEGGGGIQVFDMGQIDSGVVTLVSQGSGNTHNVAINEDSRTLYRCGANNGFSIYSLSNPTNPSFVSTWTGRYVHDAQIITYTTERYAGSEIAFCFCGDSGLYVLDVTDKQNIDVLSSYQYPNTRYAHQGWLSPNERYLYLNDEADETGLGVATTTHVIDVSDLSNPLEVATFSSGSSAIDHNLYVLGKLIFEANYRSGLRVFDATSPLAPVEVAFFDTYPPNDNANFNGLWSTYPFLPSRTVLGSDMEKGLFIWMLDCNGNAISDHQDITTGTSEDCGGNGNGIPDECEPDCNDNGIADSCDLSTGTSVDLNLTGVPDECEFCDPPACDDANPCTDDICNVDVCEHPNNSDPCSDDDSCTENDMCSGGTCQGTPNTCTDGNVCTDDSCDPGIGCFFLANSIPCDDLDPCTADDTCSGGFCVGQPTVILYGDVTGGDGMIDIDDIVYLLSAFADSQPCTNYPGSNLVPCGQACEEGPVDIDDILGILAAFAGVAPCPDPC